MEEEAAIQTTIIHLTKEEKEALYIALQWPEDRAAAIRLFTPTHLTEVQF